LIFTKEDNSNDFVVELFGNSLKDNSLEEIDSVNSLFQSDVFNNTSQHAPEEGAYISSLNEKEKNAKFVNKRVKERYPARWIARGVLGEKRVPFNAFLQDISIFGCLMYTSQLLSPGDKAYLQIEAYSFGKLRVIDAIVVFKHTSLSKNSFKGGVQFLKITDVSKQFIKEYVSGKDPHKKVVGLKSASLRSEIL
jgi:hypothetical protein